MGVGGEGGVRGRGYERTRIRARVEHGVRGEAGGSSEGTGLRKRVETGGESEGR